MKTPAKKKYDSFRRRKVITAARASDKILDRAIRAKGFAKAEIVKKWAHIVGDELAQVCFPVSLKFPMKQRAGGKLTVKTTGAYAPLLQHRLGFIIERVNQYFGYGAVKDIFIVQGIIQQTIRKKPQKRPIEKQEAVYLTQVTAGKETDLSRSIKRLGEAVLTTHKK